MKNHFFLKGKTTGQTLNQFTIIKSIIIIFFFWRNNYNNSCVCLTVKEKYLLFFFALTHINDLYQRRQHFTLSFLFFVSMHISLSWLSFFSKRLPLGCSLFSLMRLPLSLSFICGTPLLLLSPILMWHTSFCFYKQVCYPT